jgi:predicted ribonuclease YlaK
MLHRNQDVREKAKKVITRIKGWRAQGPLLDGVLVDKTIIVRALHNEPKVADSLSWLDADNADDRIVASVLHIQATSPSAHVILVTGDINLQNKADAAMIETVEINFESLD